LRKLEILKKRRVTKSDKRLHFENLKKPKIFEKVKYIKMVGHIYRG
jgi:hypothetical protein